MSAAKATLLAAAVREAVEDAKRNVSPLLITPGSDRVLQLQGMTGTQTRHLYNGLVCRLARCVPPPLKYLEVGTWGGSSLAASLYGNETLVDAVVLDNWSEFNHMLTPIRRGDGTEFQATPKEVFQHNRATVLSALPDARLHIIEKDCFDVHEIPLPSVDLYVYDGPHELLEHEKSITNFAGMLADVAVIVVDDWNWTEVREGTWRGLVLAGLRVHSYVEVFTPGKKNMDATGFWNGVAVFVVDKTRQQ